MAGIPAQAESCLNNDVRPAPLSSLPWLEIARLKTIVLAVSHLDAAQRVSFLIVVARGRRAQQPVGASQTGCCRQSHGAILPTTFPAPCARIDAKC